MRPARRCRSKTLRLLGVRTRASTWPGQLILNEEKEPTPNKTGALYLPDGARRQGLAAFGLVAAHQADLRAAPASLHGLEVVRGGLHRRHAVRRRHCRHVCRPRRLSRRIHGLGSCREKACLGNPRELPGMERHGRHRGRRRLLRYDGSLVQGGRCDQWQATVAVPCRFGDHRPAGDVPGQRRRTVRRHPGGCRRLGRAIANAKLDPRARNEALGFTGAMQDLPAVTGAGNELLVFTLPKTTAPTAPGESECAEQASFAASPLGRGVACVLLSAAAAHLGVERQAQSRPGPAGAGELPTCGSRTERCSRCP